MGFMNAADELLVKNWVAVVKNSLHMGRERYIYILNIILYVYRNIYYIKYNMYIEIMALLH